MSGGSGLRKREENGGVAYGPLVLENTRAEFHPRLESICQSSHVFLSAYCRSVHLTTVFEVIFQC